MEETLSQTQDQWSDGLLKNGAGVAPERVQSSLEVSNEELLRVQGLSVNLFVCDESVNLAPCLVHTSPKSVEMMTVRGYQSVVVGNRFGT